MPLNVMDVHYRSFQKQVLPVLLQRNIGVLAMKSLGGTGVIVEQAGIPVEEALRYVLSLPISTLVSGIDSEKVLDQNLKIVREFRPMPVEERAAVESKTLHWPATDGSSSSSHRRCSTGPSIASNTGSRPRSAEGVSLGSIRPRTLMPGLLDHTAADVGQPLVAAVVKEGEMLVLETHQMQDRGMDIIDVGLFGDGDEPGFIGARRRPTRP